MPQTAVAFDSSVGNAALTRRSVEMLLMAIGTGQAAGSLIANAAASSSDGTRRTVPGGIRQARCYF